MEQKQFKILSIDGGGIRGVLPARFLCEMEDELVRSGVSDPRLCDYFDLICGTSTGGIIAIGLALGMRSKDILDLYKKHGSKIFNKKSKLINSVRLKSRYNSKYLHDILQKTFAQYSDNGDTRLGHAKTRLCIPTFNAFSGSINVYKTPHHEELIRDYLIPAHHAAVSTSSAPFYFAPHSFKYECPVTGSQNEIQNNIDGGVFANNPTLIGIFEATQSLQIPFSEIQVLSLGTGNMKYKEVSNNVKFGPLYWIKNVRIMELMFNTQSEHTDNLIKFLNNGIGQTGNNKFIYKRIQYEFQKGENVGLDETSKINQLEGYAHQLYKINGSSILDTFLKETKREYKPFKTL